jgi:aminoglycoside phosphotransferase (APT) family kinase protein
VTYLVNDELILRFSKETDPMLRAEMVAREARLLTEVAGISPLPVPAPRFVIPEQGVLAYGRLPGTQLLRVPAPQRMARAADIGAVLGDLLAALHGVPVERFGDLVEEDVEPLSVWQEEAADTVAEIIGEIPVQYHKAIAVFLDAPAPEAEYTPVFSHNDLGIEHVLVDAESGAITGIIDWSDAAIVDPAYDFGLIYRDLGPEAFAAAAGRAKPDGIAERAGFYARCAVLEDFAYGLDTGFDPYVDKSLAALEWLFQTP